MTQPVQQPAKGTSVNLATVPPKHIRRTYIEGFYNNDRRHSAIGWHTPASVHYGTHGAIDDATP